MKGQLILAVSLIVLLLIAIYKMFDKDRELSLSLIDCERLRLENQQLFLLQQRSQVELAMNNNEGATERNPIGFKLESNE